MSNAIPFSDIRAVQAWCEKAKPAPTDADFHNQLGCTMEEISELFSQLDSTDPVTQSHIRFLEEAVQRFGESLKANKIVVQVLDDHEFFDALLDIQVTTTSTGNTRGYDMGGGLAEVNSANWSKFDKNGNPILDANGKVSKGPCYRKADLKPYLVKPNLEKE